MTPDPLAGIQFAKFGLAGATRNPRWQEIWASAVGQLPNGVRSVAVAYADWRTCDAPPPNEVIELGGVLGCAAILIDTYDKTRGGLLAYCSPSELDRLIISARKQNLLTVVGGSLDLEAIRTIAPLQPDFAAIRTAACGSNRAGRLDETRVRELVRFIAQLRCEYTMKNL